MNAMTHFPHRLHWDAHELADAVPMKLSELYGFDIRRDGPAAACANCDEPPARRRRYARADALPALFRIA